MSEENQSRGAVRGVVRVLLLVFTLLFGANWKRKNESKRRKRKANEATPVERENQTVHFVFRGVDSGSKFKVNSSTHYQKPLPNTIFITNIF